MFIVFLLLISAVSGGSQERVDAFPLVSGIQQSLRGPVATYEERLAELDRWYEQSLGVLYRQYEEALLSEISAEAYEAQLLPLFERVEEERASLIQARDLAAATIHDLIQSNPPVPGSPAAAALLTWSSGRVRATPRVQEMALELLQADFSSASVEQADAFRNAVSSTHFAPGSEANLLDAQLSSLIELIAVQLLLASDQERPQFVNQTVEALSALGSGGTEIGESLAGLSRRATVEAQIVRAPIPPAAVAALRPQLFLSQASADESRQLQWRALAAQLGVVSRTAVSLLGERARVDPVFAFHIERADSLLLQANFRERQRFAGRLGLSQTAAARIIQTLYAARSYVGPASLLHKGVTGSMELPANGTFPPELGSTAPVRFHEQYLELGRDNALLVAELASGSDPLSGDDYRWTMLGALSHPYALWLLATDPELSEAALILDRFVSSVYEETLSLADLAPGIINLSEPGGFTRFDRTFLVGSPEEADALYESFVQSAQGLDGLPASYLGEYAPGISQAEHWAHIHGLHVAVAREADLVAAFTSRTAPWFILAALPEIPDERFAHEVRGAAALLHVLADAKIRFQQYRQFSLSAFAPRAELSSAWAVAAVEFRTPSTVAVEALQRLFDWSSAQEISASLSRQAQVLERAGMIAERALAADLMVFAGARLLEE